MATQKNYELRFYLPNSFCTEEHKYLRSQSYSLKEVDEYTTWFNKREELAFDFLKKQIGEEKANVIREYYKNKDKNIGESIALIKKNKNVNFEYQTPIMLLFDAEIFDRTYVQRNLMTYVYLSKGYDNFSERAKKAFKSGFIGELIGPLLKDQNVNKEKVLEITKEIASEAIDYKLNEKKIEKIVSSKAEVNNMPKIKEVLMHRYETSKPFLHWNRKIDKLCSQGQLGDAENNMDYFWTICNLKSENYSYSICRRLHEYYRVYDRAIKKAELEREIKERRTGYRRNGFPEEDIEKLIQSYKNTMEQAKIDSCLKLFKNNPKINTEDNPDKHIIKNEQLLLEEIVVYPEDMDESPIIINGKTIEPRIM